MLTMTDVTHLIVQLYNVCIAEYYSRHSSIRDFLIKKFSLYSPIEPLHKMTTRVELGIAPSSELQ